MDLSRIVKWVVILALLFVVWKYVIPWVKDEGSGFDKSSSASKSSGGDQSCIASAERASNTWGSGLGRFVNPPYDLGAWSNFRGDVDAKINAADADCSCGAESCQKVKNAMSELRSLVGDFDTAIRNGSSPGQDAVQRQEQIDRQIDDARELVRAGK
jgi:hypothetical protein